MASIVPMLRLIVVILCSTALTSSATPFLHTPNAGCPIPDSFAICVPMCVRDIRQCPQDQAPTCEEGSSFCPEYVYLVTTSPVPTSLWPCFQWSMSPWSRAFVCLRLGARRVCLSRLLFGALQACGEAHPLRRLRHTAGFELCDCAQYKHGGNLPPELDGCHTIPNWKCHKSCRFLALPNWHIPNSRLAFLVLQESRGNKNHVS